MSSEDDDGVVAASEAATVNQEAVLTTMNTPIGRGVHKDPVTNQKVVCLSHHLYFT